MNLKTLVVVAAIMAVIVCPAWSQNEIDTATNLMTATFDTVWQTVQDVHYDTTFGGLNWRGIRDRYYNLVADATDDDSLNRILNSMLQELGLSHNSVFRADRMARSGSPLLAEAMAGIDVRLLGDQVVITSVVPDIPAAEAGLKPGYLVTDVNGESVQSIMDEVAEKHIERFGERRKINDMTDAIIRKCYGAVGDSVVLSYKDSAGATGEVTLLFQQRDGGVEIMEGLPTVYLDFNSKKINDDIGYIYFSAFIPPADSMFIDALQQMSGIKGLVIDIRGNPGGMHEIGEAIASKLVTEETLFSIFRYRDSVNEVSVKPDPPIFTGPVVIMIDVINASASERFSGCMQSIGRAAIIGEQSGGSVGPSDVKPLPNGASFMYLVAQSLTPDGTVLEGRGVLPDVAIELDRAALLKGVDTQLQGAVEYLESAIE